ncbi:metallophosphoesterase family protein [Shouchella patagoniensis]|uniref:metallophosphoesterase family protein n=1 Tax=Shouchella patagoniensis TaxID=228576 RepID=UPI000994C2CB|nr:metallophosphoesterase family protein [Shouchella patagoniensis]
MNVLVVSDSHGWKKELAEIIDQKRDFVERIIHAGDSELDVGDQVLAGSQVVAGNCDLFAAFPQELHLEWNGIPVYITHGHHHGVKNDLDQLISHASRSEAKIAVYGHTHIAKAEKKHGVLLINPGSVRLPKGYNQGTYCIVTIEQKKAKVVYYSISGEEVPHLSKSFEL